MARDGGSESHGGARMSERARTVWFYRDFVRLNGGFLKHSHYFENVRRMPGFVPRITFSRPPSNASQARERLRLWPAADAYVARWEPMNRDVLFLAGVDWGYVDRMGLDSLDFPRINLIQGVRHADEERRGYRDLVRKAIRICVSQEVADAISATGQTNGPVLTIPNGIDITPFEPAEDGSPEKLEDRPHSITIVGYKNPDLARGLSELLNAACIEHVPTLEFLDRATFLALLGESRVVVCLPLEREGFYLPALEAMASGCLVVTLDCIGNRGFCRHEVNCLVAEHNSDSLFTETKKALAMPAPERGRMYRAARDTATRHSLEAERVRFHAVLGDVDRLWRDARRMAFAARPPAEDSASSEPEVYRPKLGFMIVGAQRCGTSALAAFLSRHPDIAMSTPGEMQLFDRPDYSPGWTAEQIDARYRPAFEEPAARLRGEAAPDYLFFPEVARELARYNPKLKLIVLLRDPVERAISGYYLEKNQGRDPRSLWLALLLEPMRLRRKHNPRAPRSLTRVCSYRRRGLYSLQLRNLYRSFDREQVLIVRSRDLSRHHDAALRRVFAFLGVSEDVRIAPELVNHAERAGRTHRVVSWLLRLSYLPELVRMRTMARSHPDLAEGEGRPPVP